MKPRSRARKKTVKKAETGMVLAAAHKWNELNGLGRVITKLLVFVAAAAAGFQGWIWFDGPIPATRSWVAFAQAPLQQTLSSLVNRGIINRLAQIEGELLTAETNKATSKTPADQTKWSLQAEKLREERAELQRELKSGVHTKGN